MLNTSRTATSGTAAITASRRMRRGPLGPKPRPPGEFAVAMFLTSSLKSIFRIPTPRHSPGWLHGVGGRAGLGAGHGRLAIGRRSHVGREQPGELAIV